LVIGEIGCVGMGRNHAKMLRRKIEIGWQRFDGLLQIRSTKNRDREKGF
jgi:hypothetical protein